MRQPFTTMLTALPLIVLFGCSEETIDYLPEEYPIYSTKSTHKDSDETLECLLREASLTNSPNAYEYNETANGWGVDIIYGKNGIIGGYRIGRVEHIEAQLVFYYRPKAGNFGMDVYNVETTIPRIFDRCG